jgi:hypothetical protein
MGRYAAALTAAGADLMESKKLVTFRSAPNDSGARGAPVSGSQEAEARWEFSVAASNLTTVIPPDIRKFLRLVS